MLKRGFTFIEMIMVILILGILSVVIVTDIVSSTTMARLEAAKFKLKSDIIYAQGLAVTQQLRHGLVFDPPNETYSVYRQDTANIVNNPLTGNPFTVNYSADSDFKGVDLASTSFGSPTTNRVEFDTLGIPYSGTGPADQLTVNGTVILNYQGSTRTITITKNTGKTD